MKKDFSRKANFVAGGHMAKTPSSLTYSSLVSQDSAKIAFLVAELNGLDIRSYDIENTYLNAPCYKQV